MRRVHTAFFSKRRKKGAFCKHVDAAYGYTDAQYPGGNVLGLVAA